MQPLSVRALMLESRRLREQSSRLRKQVEASTKRSNDLRRASAGEDPQPSAAHLSLMRGSAVKERVVLVHLPTVEAKIEITYPACLDSQEGREQRYC